MDNLRREYLGPETPVRRWDIVAMIVGVMLTLITTFGAAAWGIYWQLL